jgi:hypothetical protein
MMASYEEHNPLKPITHAHDNLGELVVCFGTVSRDKLSIKSFVIVSGAAAKLEPAKDYKKTRIVSPTVKETKLEQRTVRNLPAKEDLYLLLSFL